MILHINMKEWIRPTQTEDNVFGYFVYYIVYTKVYRQTRSLATPRLMAKGFVQI